MSSMSAWTAPIIAVLFGPGVVVETLETEQAPPLSTVFVTTVVPMTLVVVVFGFVVGLEGQTVVIVLVVVPPPALAGPTVNSAARPTAVARTKFRRKAGLTLLKQIAPSLSRSCEALSMIHPLHLIGARLAFDATMRI